MSDIRPLSNLPHILAKIGQNSTSPKSLKMHSTQHQGADFEFSPFWTYHWALGGVRAPLPNFPPISPIFLDFPKFPDLPDFPPISPDFPFGGDRFFCRWRLEMKTWRQNKPGVVVG